MADITPEKTAQLKLGESFTFERVVIRRTERGLTIGPDPGSLYISFRVRRGSMGNEYNVHAVLVGSELFIYLSSGSGLGFISEAQIFETHRVSITQ